MLREKPRRTNQLQDIDKTESTTVSEGCEEKPIHPVSQDLVDKSVLYKIWNIATFQSKVRK